MSLGARIVFGNSGRFIRLLCGSDKMPQQPHVFFMVAG